MKAFIHEAAPSLLLDKYAELKDIITKEKIKDPKKDLSFFEDMLRVMHFSHGYMQELKFLVTRNQFLEHQNEFLIEHSRHLQQRVDEIDTIIHLRSTNRLQETIDLSEEVVRFTKTTDRVLSIRDMMNELKETANDNPSSGSQHRQ